MTENDRIEALVSIVGSLGLAILELREMTLALKLDKMSDFEKKSHGVAQNMDKVVHAIEKLVENFTNNR